MGHEPGEQQCLFPLIPLLSWRLGCSLPPGTGRAPLTRGLYNLSQQKVRKSSLHLSFLKFLQLQVFTMLRCHVWGGMYWTFSTPSTQYF